jgi:hypothetical protein
VGLGRPANQGPAEPRDRFRRYRGLASGIATVDGDGLWLPRISAAYSILEMKEVGIRRALLAAACAIHRSEAKQAPAHRRGRACNCACVEA